MWAAIGVTAAIMVFIYYGGLERLVFRWNDSEEYGYGYLIPVLTVFFIWLRKNEIEKLPFKGSLLGVLAVMAGIFTFVLGELSTLYIIIQYSFLLTLYGLVLSYTGWKAFRIMLVPLLFLVFMIPLPIFLYQGLSAQLQLVSSELGVGFIRLLGISVYLEGNVIDLGSYKLQVVEACSGLRYLFPLAALSFVAAYIFKAPFWRRAIIFLSSVPITIVMNSFRIVVIGILVDKWGPGQAEGFLHYFEGWVIFMACMAILIFEMWVLSRVGRKKEKLSDLFSIDLPSPTPSDVEIRHRKISYTAVGSIVLLVSAAAASDMLEERNEIFPERESFSSFPVEVEGWGSHPGKLEPIILNTLKLDDYIMSDYTDSDNHYVNFYVAYYASQSKGESAHSPRTCIPGGGWVITSITQKTLDGITAGGAPLAVNRIVIQQGDTRQLVYYWFQGRGRVITSEYMVKWYLFWDALTRNRTDGALVRLITTVSPEEVDGAGDQRLEGFARDVVPRLDAYIPR
jgi:exosortase D (VPLPA-CTERM-specific)